MKSKLNLVLDKKIGYQFSLSYNIFNKNDFLSQKKKKTEDKQSGNI